MGAVLGISAGCLLGMFRLLFLADPTHNLDRTRGKSGRYPKGYNGVSDATRRDASVAKHSNLVYAVL